jgi:predicted porin
MKQRLSVLALSAMIATPAVMAVDAPTIYGRINKEIRHIEQSPEINRGKITGSRDVGGAETMLGAKGMVPFETGVEAKYAIELGLNSNIDTGASSSGTVDGNGERLRIRQAIMHLISKYGAVSIGQGWALDSIRQMGLDPLAGTGAQLLGLESTDVVGTTPGMFGMRTRYIVDQLTYRIEANGIGLALSTDNNNTGDSLVRNSDGARAKYYTAMGTFDHDFGGLMMNSHAVYSRGDIESNSVAVGIAGQPALDADVAYWTLGSKLSIGAFSFAAAYSESDEGEYDGDARASFVNPMQRERKHYLATLNYNLNSVWTIAANYGRTNFGENEAPVTGITDASGTTTATSTVVGGYQSTKAIGIIHNCSSNIKSRLVYAHQIREAGKIDSAASATPTDIFGTGGNRTKNAAKTIIAGVTLTF